MRSTRYTALVMPGGLAQLDAAVLVDFAVDVEDVAQHREQVLLDAADHAAVHERRGRRIVQFELDAPGLPHDVDVEIGIAVEDRAGVVGLAPAVQDSERAAAIQRVEAATRAVEQPVDLHLRQVLEAAGRRDTRVDETVVLGRSRGYGDLGPLHHHFRISIGIPAVVRSQTSTMSALLSAMQPSVQSRVA